MWSKKPHTSSATLQNLTPVLSVQSFQATDNPLSWIMFWPQPSSRLLIKSCRLNCVLLVSPFACLTFLRTAYAFALSATKASIKPSVHFMTVYPFSIRTIRKGNDQSRYTVRMWTLLADFSLYWYLIIKANYFILGFMPGTKRKRKKTLIFSPIINHRSFFFFFFFFSFHSTEYK